MIDIHSHILPGVDDGASSMKESLHMLDGEKTGNHRCVCSFTLFQSVSEQRSREAETASG